MAATTRRGILIGIAGGTGAGKTLVAQSISEDLGSENVLIIEQDSYYRDLRNIPLGERESRNFDHPEAFDRDLLRTQLETLLTGGEVDLPVYEMRTHTRNPQTVRAKARRIEVQSEMVALVATAMR